MAFLDRAANRGSISTGSYQIDYSLKLEADNSEYLGTGNISTTPTDAKIGTSNSKSPIFVLVSTNSGLRVISPGTIATSS